MGMYGSRAVTLLVLISDDVINRILKLYIQTNILVYVTRCYTDLTSKVLKERTFGQSSAVLVVSSLFQIPEHLSAGQYTLRVRGLGPGLYFQNSTGIDCIDKSIIIFVQTDKAKYKPGQTGILAKHLLYN